MEHFAFLSQLIQQLHDEPDRDARPLDEMLKRMGTIAKQVEVLASDRLAKLDRTIE